MPIAAAHRNFGSRTGFQTYPMKSLLHLTFILLCTTFANAKPQPVSLLDGRPPLAGGPFNKLPAELRERIETAQRNAMAEPGIREAREKLAQEAAELRDRVRDAMFEIDPGLRDAIRAEIPKAKFGDETKRPPEGIAGLTPDEREALLSAREAVKNHPNVVATRETLERANTPEARQSAGTAYRAAMAEALDE